MPIKNRIKKYLEGGIYYIYNKGIDGKIIFPEAADFEFFEKTIRRYLVRWSEAEDNRGMFKEQRPYLKRHREEMNLEGKVEVLAYCLSPLEIRLLVKQSERQAITKMMRRVMTNYVMYFNQKYQRRGGLFEGPYKAVLLTDAENILMVSKVIHMNKPVKAVKRFGIVETLTFGDPEEYLYSSFGVILRKRESDWVKIKMVEDLFEKWKNGRWKNYREFVMDAKLETDKVMKELGVE